MSNVMRGALYSRNHLESVFGGRGYIAARAYSNTAEDPKVDPLRIARPYSEMPCVKMIPFFGSSWTYFPLIGKYSVNKLHKADISKYQLYGDVVRERFGNVEVVSSFHPDTMKIFSENEGIYPSRSDFSCLKVYRQKRKEWFEPNGFLVSKGREWYNMRECLTRYLAIPNCYKTYMESLNDIALDFLQVIPFKVDSYREIPDVVPYLRKWALECVARITLNTRLGCLNLIMDPESDTVKILDALDTQLSCMYRLEAASGNFPLWKYLPTGTWMKFKKAADTFTSLSYKYINRAVQSTASPFVEVKPEEMPTFLQYMIITEKVNLSRAVVTVADIILAGLDTAAHTAGFLLYNLAKNPEKQELAYQEICKLLPKGEDKMTFETYEKSDYLKSCLKESMRLNPTVRGNVRVLDRDVAISGYRVPAGTTIICVLQVIHRNEKYFKNANRFIPERWNSEESKDMNEFAFQPFGYGKRSCLGKDLAEMQIVTLVTEILRKYTVEYTHGEIDMDTKLINVPDRPLKLKFVERINLHC